MKIDHKELTEKVKEIFEKTEDKTEAVIEAMQLINEQQHEELIAQLQEESEKAQNDAEYRQKLGLHALNENEKKFYSVLKEGNIKEAITAGQIDVIPTEIIDRTMEDVKKASDLLSLISFTPSDVKRWITGAHSGSAAWGDLTGAIGGELTASITGLNIELHKLTAYLIIPKSIRELALPFVDKYFTAILQEAMQDGVEKGYLNGDGKNAPVGILRQISATDTDGTQKAKTVIATVTKMTPKGLSGVRKTLTNNGKRTVPEIALICNPLDEAEYVDPAMMVMNSSGVWVNATGLPIRKYVTTNCPQGTGIFTLPGYYTMGFSGMVLKTYTETKALDDADVVIAKVYGNGRADDDNVAVPFDVSKLTELKIPVENTPVTA